MIETSPIKRVFGHSFSMGIYTIGLVVLFSSLVFIEEYLNEKAHFAALNETNNWDWLEAKKIRKMLYELEIGRLAQTSNGNIQAREDREFIESCIKGKIENTDTSGIIQCHIFRSNILQSEPPDIKKETASIKADKKHKSSCDLGNGIDQIGQCALNNRKIQDIVGETKIPLTLAKIFIVLAIIAVTLSINDRSEEPPGRALMPLIPPNWRRRYVLQQSGARGFKRANNLRRPGDRNSVGRAWFRNPNFWGRAFSRICFVLGVLFSAYPIHVSLKLHNYELNSEQLDVSSWSILILDGETMCGLRQCREAPAVVKNIMCRLHLHSCKKEDGAFKQNELEEAADKYDFEKDCKRLPGGFPRPDGTKICWCGERPGNKGQCLSDRYGYRYKYKHYKNKEITQSWKEQAQGDE